MDIWMCLLIVGVGFIAGFINTLAGSGSLLTLPLLIFLGLPANVANGTNRIGVMLQSLVAVGRFKQKKVFQWKEGIWLTIPAVVGSFIGAAFAVNLNDQIMNRVIGLLLIFMFFLLLYKPDKWLTNKESISTKPSFIQVLIFFAIGLYGGFIQAGVGYFLLAGLVFGAGYNLVKANAIKSLIVFVFTVAAIGVFIYNGQVNFMYGIVLAIGNMLGALIATRVAIKRGAKFIRWFLLVTVLVFAVKLLFF